jgi:hypothetical protein
MGQFALIGILLIIGDFMLLALGLGLKFNYCFLPVHSVKVE